MICHEVCIQDNGNYIYFNFKNNRLSITPGNLYKVNDCFIICTLIDLDDMFRPCCFQFIMIDKKMYNSIYKSNIKYDIIELI